MNVKDNFKPHRSHKMTPWESTIVTLGSTSQFGEFRKCENCEAEEAKSVSGHKAHDALAQPCTP